MLAFGIFRKKKMLFSDCSIVANYLGGSLDCQCQDWYVISQRYFLRHPNLVVLEAPDNPHK